ncbi:hypothetical protein Tco_1087075, partial [Tanacetum coccineum]
MAEENRRESKQIVYLSGLGAQHIRPEKDAEKQTNPTATITANSTTVALVMDLSTRDDLFCGNIGRSS